MFFWNDVGSIPMARGKKPGQTWFYPTHNLGFIRPKRGGKNDKGVLTPGWSQSQFLSKTREQVPSTLASVNPAKTTLRKFLRMLLIKCSGSREGVGADSRTQSWTGPVCPICNGNRASWNWWAVNLVFFIIFRFEKKWAVAWFLVSLIFFWKKIK